MTSENENENRKTIADVLAKMERESIIHVCIPATDLERYVKQIKEALKREKAEIEADALAVCGIVEAARHKAYDTRTAEKSSAVCNAAAMREALQKIREKCVIYNNDLAEEIDALCGNALSAPARNCDLYATRPEMSMSYEAYRKAAMKRYGNGLTGRVPTVKQKPMTYDEWLIAPAAERKGEGDEQK